MIQATWICDYCGEEINTREGWAHLTIEGWGIDVSDFSRCKLDYEHHYHTGSADSCYRKAYDALLLAEEWGPTLETIPTISGQAVAARRRKHRKVGE